MGNQVAIYARYSSDNQNKRSIEDQIRLCQGMLRPGEQLVEQFTDAALSGQRKDNRPGLLALITAMQVRAIDVVICEDVSRLARRMQDIAELHDLARYHGVEMRTVADGGEISRFHVGIHGLMDDVHREEIGRRTKRGHIGNIRRGKSACGLAYGYRKVALNDAGEAEGGLRAIDAAQAEIVREIFDRFGSGEPPVSIARSLNRRDVPTARGGKWHSSTILGQHSRPTGIVRNDIYRGSLTYNRMSYPRDPQTRRRRGRVNAEADWVIEPAPHLRIVTEAQWATAQEEVARRKDSKHMPMHHRRAARPYKYLIGRKLYHACGAHMRIRHNQHYVCSDGFVGAGCGTANKVNAAQIRARVLAQLAGWSDAEIARYTARFADAAARSSVARDKLKVQIARDRVRLERYYDAVEKGVVLDDDLTARINRLKADIEQAETRLRRFDELYVRQPITRGTLKRIRARAKALAAQGDSKVVDLFVDGLVERIVIGGATGRDMDKVRIEYDWVRISRGVAC